MDQIGELRVAAYHAGRHLRAGSQYEPRLRALGADGDGEVLVAIAPASEGGSTGDGAHDGADVILGTVMLQPWPAAGEVVRGAGEAEIRALAVAPAAQGTGIGDALLQAVIERARLRSVGHLVLLTSKSMVTAQRLYARSGFARLPDRDRPEHDLLAYGLQLDPA